MLTRSFLSGRVKIIPGRISVSYVKRQARDQRASAKSIKCERRPATKSELRSANAASEDHVETFVFTSAELDRQSIVLEKEDEIRLSSGEVFSITTIIYELLRTRHKAVCVKQHDNAPDLSLVVE